MKSKTVHQTGFTLLEVLLAVLVLGISLSVFFSAVNQGIAAAVKAQDYQISREMLHELALREPLDLEEVEEGSTEGTFTHPVHGRILWTRTFTEEGREEEKFFRVSTTVSRGAANSSQTETVESFLHLPSAMKGGWVKEGFDGS